jgi:hypothetical protein
MRLRRALLALLLALLGVGVAPPLAAYAGGPTSVLMVSPNLERAQAAYYSDVLYTELVDGVGDGQVGSAGAPPGVDTNGGEDVRLTWLIHDMQIWRIDRIHLTSADGVWIETVVDRTGDGEMLDQPASWHRAADQDRLLAALSTAGLLGDSAVAPTSHADSPADEAGATVPSRSMPFPALIAAGLGGLVLGAAGAFVAMQVRRRTPAERPERVTLSG